MDNEVHYVLLQKCIFCHIRYQNITKLATNKKNRDMAKIDFHFNNIMLYTP